MYSLQMNRTRLTVLLFLIFASPLAVAGASVVAEPTVLDFGYVSRGEPVVSEFVLRNETASSRLIQFMDFSIPGLVAQVSPRIEPGEAVSVRVRLDTSEYTGNVEGKITLLFDDPDRTEVVVTVKATVEPTTD
jgi:hypothetical protein